MTNESKNKKKDNIYLENGEKIQRKGNLYLKISVYTN
jgi:hypothetical protein